MAETQPERGAELDGAVEEREPVSAQTPTSAPPIRAPHLVRHRWQPGQSGNPSGRPRESGSLAAALRRVGIQPAKARAELAKLADKLGLDPDEARNIDVVSGLIFDSICQLLLRTIRGEIGAGDKLVGLLTILHKALDGDEQRISIATPPNLQMAMASVSAVLGFRLEASQELPGANGWHGQEVSDAELG